MSLGWLFAGLLFSADATNPQGDRLVAVAFASGERTSVRVTLDSRSVPFEASTAKGMKRNVLVVRCRPDSIEFELASDQAEQTIKWSTPLVTSFALRPQSEPARSRPLAKAVAAELRKLANASTQESEQSVWFTYIVPNYVSDLGALYVWTKESSPIEDTNNRGLPGRMHTSEIPNFGAESVLVRQQSAFPTISHLIQKELGPNIAVLAIPVFSVKMIRNSAEARKLAKASTQFNGFALVDPADSMSTEAICLHSRNLADRSIVLKIKDSTGRAAETNKKGRLLRIESQFASKRVTIVRRLHERSHAE